MAFQRKNQKKPLPPWKENLFAHHNPKPSRSDRAEFPAAVVKELTEEAKGKCQCGCGRPDTETHHVMPRTRGGRGVKSNGMRVNGICNTRIHDNEDELQGWIAEYERRHGPFFWFDEQDREEQIRRENASTAVEVQRKEREQQIEPIVALLSRAAGRQLRAKEVRAIETLAGTRHLETVKAMAEDIAHQAGMRRSWGYGQFDD